MSSAPRPESPRPTASRSTPVLTHEFATDFPELAQPWKAVLAPAPQLLELNEQLAEQLGLDSRYFRSPEGIRFLVGNDNPEGAQPVAQAYAGHQFGGYSPRLGDGRALLLGELSSGHDLHLKGSGRTPFSRGGDGLAAVGPTLREYVISEAMHALGVPSTRALAVVATGSLVLREQSLPGAVLARIASSHLRVGTFQFARATGDEELLRRLADHAISRHYPHIRASENPYLELFSTVVDAQASLVAKWMLLGFVHGVMNTDNVTISGETIDYGPCAFMESFDPATVFSSIDAQGRYAYGNQPHIMQWNLARFAETLIPLVHPQEREAVDLLTEVLGTFPARYSTAWMSGMRQKLGLGDGLGDGLGREDGRSREDGVEDEVAQNLAEDLVQLLATHRVDYTSFFAALTEAASEQEEGVRAVLGDSADSWLARWRRLGPSPQIMATANPIYIPRNHIVEEALAAATQGELDPVRELVAVISQPYTVRPGLERFAQPAPAGGAPYVTYCGT